MVTKFNQESVTTRQDLIFSSILAGWAKKLTCYSIDFHSKFIKISLNFPQKFSSNLLEEKSKKSSRTFSGKNLSFKKVSIPQEAKFPQSDFPGKIFK